MGHQFEAYPLVHSFCICILKIFISLARKVTGDKRITKKLRNRLIPAIFVGVTIAPGCQWARTYQVVSVASLLSENRASRVSIRIAADLTCPEVVSFPFQQRLTLNGAFADSTLPAAHVIDEKEEWGVIVDAGVEEEDLLQFDGICNENAPQFQRTKTVKIMMSIDPDTAPDEAESSEDESEEPEEIGGVPDLHLDIFDPLEPASQKLQAPAHGPRQSRLRSLSQEVVLRQLGGEMISQLLAQFVDLFGRLPTACALRTKNQKNGSL